MTIKQMAKKLESATGRKADIRDAANGSQIIILDTNYCGMYAPKSTFDALDAAWAVVRRSRKFVMSVHPACVCAYVSERAAALDI